MDHLQHRDDILKDGEAVRVPVMLMDSVQRDVSASVGISPRSLPLTDTEREQRNALYDRQKKELSERWKHPNPQDAPAVADTVVTKDHYAAYEARVSSAWRGGST